MFCAMPYRSVQALAVLSGKTLDALRQVAVAGGASTSPGDIGQEEALASLESLGVTTLGDAGTDGLLRSHARTAGARSPSCLLARARLACCIDAPKKRWERQRNNSQRS